MSVEDKRMGRLILHEASRSQDLDISSMTISVTHSVGFLGGTIKPVMGGDGRQLKENVRLMVEGLLQHIPALKDVVVDAVLQEDPKRR